MNHNIDIYQDIKKEIKIDAEGKGYISIRGAARVCDVSQTSIQKLLTRLGDNLAQAESLESFAGKDFRGDNLPDFLLSAIVEYYTLDAGRYCTEQAKKFYRAFNVAGARDWMQRLSGWKQKQNDRTCINLLWMQRESQFYADNVIPNGYWCIYSELFFVAKCLEYKGFLLPDRAELDISVGLCWNKYLKSCNVDTNFPRYPHKYPDHRGDQMAKIYPNDLLGCFRDWLADVYMGEKFKTYIKRLPSRHKSDEDLKRVIDALGKIDDVRALVWKQHNRLAS